MFDKEPIIMYKQNDKDYNHDAEKQAALRRRSNKQKKSRNGLSGDHMPSSIEQNFNSSKDVRSLGPSQLKAMTREEGSPLTSNFSEQISPENQQNNGQSPPQPRNESYD